MLGACNLTEQTVPTAKQSTNLTISDYQRAEQLLRKSTGKLVFGTVKNSKWLDNDRLTYRTSVVGGYKFVLADAAKREKTAAFDHAKIAAALSDDTVTYSALDLPFRSFSFNEQYSAIKFSVKKQAYSCVLSSATCEKVAAKKKFRGQVVSPDGTKAVFIREHNLWLRDTTTNKELALTNDGKADYGYGTNNAGWLRSSTPVLLWSPDSQKIATFQHDSRQVKSMHLVSTNVGHPTLDSWKYPLPGDKHIFMMERLVIDVASKKITRFDMAPDPQRSTVTDHVYSRGKMLDVQWNDRSDSLAFVSVSRNYQHVELRVADPKTGDVVSIMDETVKSFFESGKGKANWQYLPQSNEVIWFSQRDDWGHLYLYDLSSGKLKQQITHGDWNVLQVRHIDKDNRVIYFTGAGREEGDPYFKYFYSVNFDGSALTLLTPEMASHQVVMNEAGSRFVDLFSTPSHPEQSLIRNVDGKIAVVLEKSDITQLKATHWRAPESFIVKDRNGQHDIYGLMYKPSNFDANKSYPVVNYLYPGPQTGSIGRRTFSASRGDKQAIAELGFIQIEIDALGTPKRSNSFHDFNHGNMGDSGVPDQMAAIKQLGAKYSWIDLDRVGIWGHSGGGFASTNAILKYPDFYKVAVSGAGNHDNRNYASPWGDKWQGLVVNNKDGSSNYDNQANQLVVDGLKGKLLLAHGTLDDNVPPFNTLIVVNALIKANKDFDLLMLPNRRHGFSREPYMMRKRWDYFVKHLMGKTPPKEFKFGQLDK
ncbi:MAG: DPP IV N-terminal domain-containing protein [Psychrobium sp.]|nr:DPP IV N-terminal domain-containing protein [Psychrobium sp.]